MAETHTDSRQDNNRTSHVRVLTIVLIFGLAVTAAAFGLARSFELRTQRFALERMGAERTAALERFLNDHLGGMNAIRAFFNASEEVTADEFATFTAPLIERHVSIRALEWIPLVAGADRASFEAAARAAGFQSYRITSRDAEGDMIDAPAADEYFPVYFIAPFDGNSTAHGFDLGSDPTRREAIDRARSSGRTIASAPIGLVQDESGQSSTLLLMPRYLPGMPTTTEAERIEAFNGFVLAVVRYGDLLERAMGLFRRSGVDVALRDAASDGKLLAVSADERHGDPPFDPDAASSLSVVDTLALGGRTLEVRYTPSPAFRRERTPLLSLVVLLAGAALTALVARYVVALIGRTERLRLANLRLESEISQRKESERLQRLMMNELDHRVKNNLAAVLSIADETLDGSSSIDDMRSTFTGRIFALAAVHEALAASSWGGARLDEVARLALGGYSADDASRIAIKGDHVQLTARAASALCMALHELATNAAKYGALSARHGQVELSWRIVDGRDLDVTWAESGGPPPSETWTPGFGTVLIRDVIEHELRGQVDLDFTPSGLVCRMKMPLDAEVLAEVMA